MASTHDLDLGLLFGVPVTEEEFFARVNVSDWLSKYRVEDEGNAIWCERLKQVWNDSYHPFIAAPFSQLIEYAIETGADVRTGATLKDLQDLTGRRSTVILFSHWKGPEISNDDFLSTNQDTEFADRVRDDCSALGCWLADCFTDLGLLQDSSKNKSGISCFWRWIHSRSRPQSLRAVLREAIRTTLPEEPLEEDNGVDIELEHRITREATRRDELDRIFSGLIAPGNRLELFDGMHSKEALEQAIAPDFDGLLDLTTYTSTTPADYISGARELRVRTVQFSNLQEPLWAALCVKATLQILVESGTSYMEARELAHSSLLQTLDDERERRGRAPNGEP